MYYQERKLRFIILNLTLATKTQMKILFITQKRVINAITHTNINLLQEMLGQ